MNNFLRALVLLSCFLWWLPLDAQTVEIHQIDVGAGDATLIKVHNTAGDINILLDAGSRSASENVLSYLQSANGGGLGVQPYLDYIISSHYHEDHIGGFVGSKKRNQAGCFSFNGIIGTPNCPTIYFAVLDKGDSDPVATSQVYYDYKDLADGTAGPRVDRRVRVGWLTVGQFGALGSITPPAHLVNPPAPANQGLSLGGYIDLGSDANGVPIHLRLLVCDARVYAPDKPPFYIINVADSDHINRNNAGAYRNPNNWGLAWVLEYGKFRYFTGGDIGGETTGSYIDIETPLVRELPQVYALPAAAPGHICSFKADHHGSEHSNSLVFLNGLMSTTGIISCGRQHNHPTQQVIDRIAAVNWNYAGLYFNQTWNYYMTELHYPRNIDTAHGITSGNIKGIVTNVPVPPAVLAGSQQMANLAYIYGVDHTIVPQVTGDIKLLVFPDDGPGRRIDQISVYTVKWKSYNGGAWLPGWKYTCHD